HKGAYTFFFICILFLSLINALVHWYAPKIQPLTWFAHFVSLFLLGVIGQFYRRPKIRISKDTTDVLSPADGKVVVIEETTETEYFKDKRIQVSIFMSPINVHINRNPITGIVKFFKYHPGKYLMAWNP